MHSLVTLEIIEKFSKFLSTSSLTIYSWYIHTKMGFHRLQTFRAQASTVKVMYYFILSLFYLLYPNDKCILLE